MCRFVTNGLMAKHLMAGEKIHYHNATQGRNVTQEQIIKLNKIFPLDGNCHSG
jgi:hypothetical protein